ncbi:MAG: SDR family NAD(P)-dependent oxidoreductase [Bdellovibrio sp.]|nr:SDR family NAD(P)-dependent oxidoreductase [Bdellovibrio sp.]
MEITNKKIMITGANRGIGHAFAEACAKEKAHLILAIRKADDKLIKDLKKLGASSVEIIECDLISREGVEALAKKMNQREIDLLFNNAGQLTGGLIETQPLDDIYKMFQVNVNALVHLTQSVLPQMIKRKSGKIINHASVSAVMHFPCASTYAASKAAVWAFTDCIEQELKGTGVSTLCLFTPGIKTRMFDQIDELYSKNIDVVNDSISPQEYAQKILNAVKKDWTYLEPKGATGIAFQMAQHFKGIFNWGVGQKFKR